MLGERLPKFMFTNRITFKVALQAQLTYYEMQRQQMLYQAAQVEAQLSVLTNQKTFILTDANRLEFYSIPDAGWHKLLNACERGSDIMTRDTIILRLYVAMLGHLQIVTLKPDSQFLASLVAYLRGQPDLRGALDAEKKFNFTDETKQMVKSLLLEL